MTKSPDISATVQAKPRIFYGWVIACIGAVTSFFSSLTNQGFSSYLGPLGQEFGWSRSVLAAPRSMSQLEGAMLGPIDGYIVDKFGARVVVIFGGIIMGAGLVMFGLMHSLWQYFLANLFIGLGASFAGVLPIYVTLNNWFRRKRTTAMAMTQLGISLSGLIAIPVLVWGQQHYGWRTTAIASGVVVWMVVLPVATLLKRSPESIGQLPDGDSPEDLRAPTAGAKTPPNGANGAPEFDFTLKEAVRTRAFRFMAAGNSLNLMVLSAVTVHQFLHLEQGVGLPRGTVAGALAFMAAFNLAGRFVGGYLGDRYTKRWMLSLTMAMMTVSLVPLALAQSLTPVLIWAGIYGLAWGVRAPIQFSMVGEYFGRTAYGKIQGWINAAAVPLAATAPILAGAMADWQGNYVVTIYILCGLAATSAVLYSLASPPKLPARATQAPAA